MDEWNLKAVIQGALNGAVLGVALTYAFIGFSEIVTWCKRGGK